MKTIIIGFMAIFTLVLFTGCAPTFSGIKCAEYYPQYYQNHPKSILVLPAKNTTSAADAAEHFRGTLTIPLAERGYYVFSAKLVDDFFKSENISDGELIRKIPVSKLKEIFNADAIIYVDINAWDTGYKLVSSNVDVGLSYSIVDTKTEREIWNSNSYAYSFRGLDGNNGIPGLLISAIQVAVNTGTDYTALAKVANYHGTKSVPFGPYHPSYKTDMEKVIVLQDYGKLKDGRLYVDKYFVKGNEKTEPVPLIFKLKQNGYVGFEVTNLNLFDHNGYSNYYITQEIQGKKFLRNRFFMYNGQNPYLLAENKKIYVKTEANGTIPVSNDDGEYYFQVEHVVELKK